MEVLSSQQLKVSPIVCHQSRSPTDSVIQLVLVTPASLSGLTCGNDREAARSNEIGDKYAYVFVKIKLNEEIVHRPFTSGSISSSGMRLRSIWVLISEV